MLRISLMLSAQSYRTSVESQGAGQNGIDLQVAWNGYHIG